MAINRISIPSGHPFVAIRHRGRKTVAFGARDDTLLISVTRFYMLGASAAELGRLEAEVTPFRHRSVHSREP
jgi:hypothetical protein